MSITARGFTSVAYVGPTPMSEERSDGREPALTLWSTILAMANESAFCTYRGTSWFTRQYWTATHHDYIEVGLPLETRQVAWSDIQGFEIRRNKFSGEFVVIRLSSGRRLGLPSVDSRSVSSVEDEVQALRELWEQLRGPDWTPLQR